MDKLIGRFFVIVIKGYQLVISPYLMPACRFTPTCSHYGVEAIKKHGPFKGGWYTIKRVCSCHPLNKKHGYDPVP